MKTSSTSHIARFDTLISTVKLVTWIALIAFLLPGSIGRPADAAPPIQEDPPSRLPYDGIFDAPFLDKGSTPEETHPELTAPEYVNWSRLVFQSFRNQHDWDVFAARGDGSNQVNVSNHASMDSDPRLNRDGTRVVFASNRHGTFEIYAMNADGSGQTRLTNNTTNDAFPVWAPDGSKIAFQAYRDGQAEIYVMNANGSGQTRLTNHAEYDGQPAWSPDGAKIAFVRKQSGQYRIWVMNANGSNPQQRSGQPISEDPAWSPDGSKIAYDADGNNDGWQEIWLMDAGGGNQRPVYYPSQSNTDAWVYSWSPDGRYVAFTSISWVYQQSQWYWTRAYLDAWDSANPNDTIRLSNNGADWYPDWRSLDWQAPISQMQPLPAQSPNPFTVRWSGSDVGPAGLANYDVQVKDGAGGVWTNWHMATTATSASYSGAGGHTYTFRVRARDNAGNVETWPADYDAVTTVEALPPRTSVEALAPYSRHNVLIRWGGSDPGGSGIQSYDVQVHQGSGPWTDWRRGTTDTQATFTGTTGVEQGFRVRARDYAQNLEPWPAGADATTVLYTWGIAGHATDNRGVPVVGMETTTTPAAFHTAPSNGEGAYAAHVSTEAASYTVNWSKPGYGALPGTTFTSNLDASFDVVMPPVDNVVQNWGFENGSTSWQFGGGLTGTITNSVQHSGAAAAFLGSTAHPLRSVATLVSPLRGWNDQVDSGIDAASVMHAVWIGLDNRVMYSSKPPGRSWTVPEPLTGPPAHTSGSVALHVDDAGAVHVVWCAADDVYYRQKPSGAGWSVPERIVGSGDSWYQPGLTTTIDGVVKVAWSSGGILRFAQRRPGGGWSGIQGFGTGGWFGRLIKIVADSSGRAHMMWVAGDGSGTGTVDIFHAVQNLDGSWSPTINLSEYDNHAFEGDLVVDSDGTAHAVWGADGVYYRMRPAAGSWSPPELIAAEEPSGISLFLDDRDRVHLTWADLPSSQMHYSVRSDGGWSSPVAIGPPSAWPSQSLPTLVVDENYRVHVIWVQYMYHDYQNDNSVRYSRQDDQGHWSVPVTIYQNDFVHDVRRPRLFLEQAGTPYAVWESAVDGSWSALYAGPEPAAATAEAFVSQVMEVPVAALTPTLSFLHRFGPEFPSHTRLEVLVDDGISTTAVFTATTGSDTWTHQWVDLTPWAGRSVTLRFEIVEEAGGARAWAYIDEVTVGSTYPDLWVAKRSPSVRPNDPVVYTITYGNRGGAAAASVRVTDSLPAGLVFVSAEPPPTSTGTQLVWDLGNLPGNSGPFTITLTTRADPPVSLGTVTNTAAIQSQSAELETHNNSAQAATFVGHVRYLPVIVHR